MYSYITQHCSLGQNMPHLETELQFSTVYRRISRLRIALTEIEVKAIHPVLIWLANLKRTKVCHLLEYCPLWLCPWYAMILYFCSSLLNVLFCTQAEIIGSDGRSSHLDNKTKTVTYVNHRTPHCAKVIHTVIKSFKVLMQMCICQDAPQLKETQNYWLTVTHTISVKSACGESFPWSRHVKKYIV